MPLYEYQCEACQKRFEKIQKFSDPLVDTCPTCGGKVNKLLSSPAIKFKGSGFYITDYPKKSSTDSSSKSTESSKSTSASTSSDGSSSSSSSPSSTTPSSDSSSKKD